MAGDKLLLCEASVLGRKGDHIPYYIDVFVVTTEIIVEAPGETQKHEAPARFGQLMAKVT